VSTAELIFSKAKTLPDSAQTALLQLVELLAKEPSIAQQALGHSSKAFAGPIPRMQR
jgi:hypothetical protein